MRTAKPSGTPGENHFTAEGAEYAEKSLILFFLASLAFWRLICFRAVNWYSPLRAQSTQRKALSCFSWRPWRFGG